MRARGIIFNYLYKWLYLNYKQTVIPVLYTNGYTWTIYKRLYLYYTQMAIPELYTNYYTWTIYKRLYLNSIQMALPELYTNGYTCTIYKRLYLYHKKGEHWPGGHQRKRCWPLLIVCSAHAEFEAFLCETRPEHSALWILHRKLYQSLFQ